MNFELSEEQQLLQQTVRQFLDNECPPTQLRALFEGETGFDPALWKGMVEMGLAGLHLPEALRRRGPRDDRSRPGVGVARLGRRAGPVPRRTRSRGSRSCSAGSDEQKQRWLPRLAAGDALGDDRVRRGGRSVAAGGVGARGRAQAHRRQAERAVRLARGRLRGRASRAAALALVEKSAGGIEIRSMEGVDRGRRIDRVTLRRHAGRGAAEGRRGLAARARRRPRAARGRRLRRGLAAARHVREVREDARAVRGHDRPLPGAQAPAREHGARDRARARALLVCGARLRPHPEAGAALGRARQGAPHGSRDADRARLRSRRTAGSASPGSATCSSGSSASMFDRAFLGIPSVHRERAAKLAGW